MMLAAALWQGIREARASWLLPKGGAAPLFSLQKFEGGTVNLAELHGHVVMLDFWATWCGPCVAEMPTLHKLAREYESKGVTFVAADQDDPEDAKEAVQKFVTQVQPGLGPYVAMGDPAMTRQYKVRAFPTLYVIDGEGRVIDAREAQQPEIILRGVLDKALGH
jgi:thiol-disulfide isomerase/thioredoxin